jgi:hypothetical protein
MSSAPALSFLDRLGGARKFFDAFWETQWGQFPACLRSDEIEKIASLEAIDRHVLSGGLRSPDLQIISGGRASDVPLTVSLAPATDSAFLLRAYKAGKSFRIQHLENYLPELAAWCSVLEKELGMPLRANAYFSPPGSMGLSPHYDGCDSFVIQLLGEKTWQIFSEYTEQVLLPTPDQKFSHTRHRPLGEPTSVTMRQGDVLYLPRGVMHSAFTQSTTSIHLTVSLLGATWSDLLAQIIHAEAAENIALRRLALLHGSGASPLETLTKQAQDQLSLVNLPKRLGQALNHTDGRIQGHKSRAKIGSLLEIWRSD